MDTIVIDLDGTITIDDSKKYENKTVNEPVKAALIEAKRLGFKIVVFTARNMKSFSGDIAKIKLLTLPTIKKWLETNNIPYDEIIVGKPWCGENGFYVDDKAIRPSEFSKLTTDEIKTLLIEEKNIE